MATEPTAHRRTCSLPREETRTYRDRERRQGMLRPPSVQVPSALPNARPADTPSCERPASWARRPVRECDQGPESSRPTLDDPNCLVGIGPIGGLPSARSSASARLQSHRFPEGTLPPYHSTEGFGCRGSYGWPRGEYMDDHRPERPLADEFKAVRLDGDGTSSGNRSRRDGSCHADGSSGRRSHRLVRTRAAHRPFSARHVGTRASP